MAREGPGLSALARVQARPGDAPATGTVFRDSSKIGLEKKKTQQKQLLDFCFGRSWNRDLSFWWIKASALELRRLTEGDPADPPMSDRLKERTRQRCFDACPLVSKRSALWSQETDLQFPVTARLPRHFRAKAGQMIIASNWHAQKHLNYLSAAVTQRTKSFLYVENWFYSTDLF